MTRRRALRWTLAAGAALVLYASSCWYPASWSPDSTRVVFAVPGNEGVARLAMVDLLGKLVREVGRGDRPKMTLSPAAWSPDGKWIAYMKFEVVQAASAAGADNVRESVVRTLIIQDAESGKERTVGREGLARGAIDDDTVKDAVKISKLCGPQWRGDSGALLMRKLAGTPPGVLILDMEGRALADIPVEGMLGLQTASLSPDGKCLVYARESDDRKVSFCIRNVPGGASWQVVQSMVLDDRDGAKSLGPPAWSADSEFVYLPVVETHGEDGKAWRLKRHSLKTGKADTVWTRPKATPLWVSVSTGTGSLAVLYDEEERGIEVVPPDGGQPVPVHFASDRAPLFSPALSPDGKWVAFGQGESKGGNGFVGVIVSSDGGRLRLFLPSPDQKQLMVQVLEDREETALKKLAAADDDLSAILKSKEKAPLLRGALASLDRLAEKTQVPIFREAAAAGRVRLCLTVLEAEPASGRAGLAEEARRQLARFREACPDHPLVPLLEERIEGLLKRQRPLPGTAPAETQKAK